MGSVRSSLYYRRGAGGKVAVEDMANSTGKRFFVHYTTGTDGTAYGMTPDKPFKTIDYAIGKCTASKGDIIYVMEGHAETIPATIAADVAGVQIIGLGRGALRPKVTGLTGVPMVTMTAANVVIKNVHLLAVAGVTYIVKGTAAAVAPVFEDVIFEQVAVPVIAVHFGGLLGGYGAQFTRCTFLAAVNGPDYCVHFWSSAGDFWQMDDCVANYMLAGLDNGVVYSNHLQKGYIIKDCTFLGVDDSVAVITSSVGGGIDGIMVDSNIHVTAAQTSLEDVLDDAKGMGVLNVMAYDDKSQRAVTTSTAQATAT